ncbi:hypothetical protein [Amphibacillus indicireducens]|uniref:Uncharacterized protein n=1 Tax=Amphibacillus indicireducens TaxID=1076330 RepID=A0ABP7V1L3_9BACI
MRKLFTLSLIVFLLVTTTTIGMDLDEEEIKRPFIPGREQNLF